MSQSSCKTWSCQSSAPSSLYLEFKLIWMNRLTLWHPKRDIDLHTTGSLSSHPDDAHQNWSGLWVPWLRSEELQRCQGQDEWWHSVRYGELAYYQQVDMIVLESLVRPQPRHTNTAVRSYNNACNPTAIRIDSTSNLRPQDATGNALSQSPAWSAESAKSLYPCLLDRYSEGPNRFSHDRYLQNPKNVVNLLLCLTIALTRTTPQLYIGIIFEMSIIWDGRMGIIWDGHHMGWASYERHMGVVIWQLFLRNAKFRRSAFGFTDSRFTSLISVHACDSPADNLSSKRRIMSFDWSRPPSMKIVRSVDWTTLVL